MADTATDRAAATAADKSAAADKAAASDKARATHVGAQEGATSVAEAVKRVADAAVAEIQKVNSGEKPELSAVGSAGGKVTVERLITEASFGTSGTLKIGGHQIHTRDWSTQRIVGDLPANVASGAEVIVQVDDKVSRRGKLA